MKITCFIKERKIYLLFNLLIFIVINIYSFCINSFSGNINDLIYLDFIVLILMVISVLLDYLKWIKNLKRIQQYSDCKEILIDKTENCNASDKAYQEIIAREEGKYKKVIGEYEDKLKEVEEYITKWVHEIKIPLSALKIILSRIDEIEDQEKAKNELEKMIFLINSVMYGSRTTSAKEDIFIKNENLKSIVNRAIKNNAFFLIKNSFEIKQSNLEMYVYTDAKWMCYVLEQIINNSIKYAAENSYIEFSAEECEKYIVLSIRDNGIGIADEDINRIFNKGFTGNNGRNTVYKSTGMGLYFVKKIIDKLEHKITVSSQKGKGTEFKIYFYKISDYLKVTEM